MADASTESIFEVGIEDFKEKVLDASHIQPVLVDFWAEWCPPCLALAPVLEKTMQEYQGVVRLGKVEVDENMKLAGQYQVRGFPTVVLFANGKEVDRFAGAQTVGFVREFVDRHI